jgi:hypothetical protein
MSKNCLNHPHTFCCVCDKLTKFHLRNFIPCIEKGFELCFGCKGVMKINLGPSHLLYNVCEASHGMGKWFALNALRHPHILRGTKRPLIRLLLLLNKHSGDHLQIQSHSQISGFVICKALCPTHWRVVCTKHSGISDFSDNNSDSEEDHGEQEGGNVECDPTFEAISSSSDHHLLTQGHLNDLLRDLNLSKKQAEFLGSRLKCGIFSPNTETCFFRNRQMNSKNSSLKKTVWYFEIIFAELYRLLDYNTISVAFVNWPFKS